MRGQTDVMGRFLFSLSLSFWLFALFEAGLARADERAVYVVSVAAGATEIDAVQLRTSIGAELQADAVPPGDPKAGAARGRIDVSVDRAAGQLVVSYDGGAEPLVRRVPLPSDARETSLAAVLLASNLARDEAGELAAQLRRSKPPVPQPPTPEELREERDNEILRRTLSAYAAHDGNERRAVAWTEIGLGVGATAGAIAVFVANRSSSAVDGLASLGIPLMIFGSVGLATPSRFEELRDYYESTRSGGGSPSWLRPTVEEMWKRDAVKAQKARAGLLVAVLSLSAFPIVIGSINLANDLHTSTAQSALDVATIGAGVGAAIWGVVVTRSESTTEQRLRLYERTVGHPIELTDVGLRLAPVPGGATLGLGGRF
jgi:hypothetical protein